MEHQTARDTTEGEPKPLGRRDAHMADHIGPAQSWFVASSLTRRPIGTDACLLMRRGSARTEIIDR